MKIDELAALAVAMDVQDILIKPEDVILSIQSKGKLKNTFSIPTCSEYVKKCCSLRIGLSLFDVARFMDKGLHNYIAGTFAGYMEFVLSDGIWRLSFKFDLEVDGKLVVSIQDKTPATGAVGLEAHARIAQYDNVVIKGDDVPNPNLSVSPGGKLAIPGL